MTNVELVRSSNLAGSVPYAYAAVTPAGRTVWTAGACPLDEQGTVVAPGRRRVAGAPGDGQPGGRARRRRRAAADVARSTVYVASADRSDLVAAWDVVRAAFGDHDAPSTLLGVAVLGYPDQLVEVEAVAVLPDRLASRRPR